MRTAMAALCIAILFFSIAGVAGEKKLLGEGEGFFKPDRLWLLADIPLGEELPAEERSALGVAVEGPFTLRDVDADLVFVEFLNVYCYACLMQVPIVSDVYAMVQEDEVLRRRVRFVGIAAGNEPGEVETYRERYGIEFPLVADPDFIAYDAVGNPGGTPLLVIMEGRAAAGAESGAVSHHGLLKRPETFIEEMRLRLASGFAPPEASGPPVPAVNWRELSPDLTRAEIEERLRVSAAEIGADVASVTTVDLDGETVYRLEYTEGGGLWAKLAGRSKLCNICHDIFFILLFDDGGRIVNFTPLTVTKYKNVPFDDRDTAFMKERVIGRLIGEEISFDPAVDAVSTATMSSKLIFDTMRRLHSTYDRLQKEDVHTHP